MVQTQPTQRLQPKSPTQELQQQQTTGISIHLKANDERPRLPQAAPSQPARSQLAVSPGPDSEFPCPSRLGETGQGMMFFEARAVKWPFRWSGRGRGRNERSNNKCFAYTHHSGSGAEMEEM